MIIIVKHKQKRERKLVTYCYLPLNKMCTVSPRENTRYPAAVINTTLGWAHRQHPRRVWLIRPGREPHYLSQECD